MTLPELCEPLMQYICRLSRMARKGASATADDVRAQIKALLADMKSKAAAIPGMPQQFDKVELPLIFFADSMIRESALPFARQWRDLAQERNELAGDEKFYDLLEETLADRSEAATERLQIFYTCLGLGFTGWYQGQPEYLRKKMMELFARIRSRGDADATGRLCPESYQNINTADLIQPPGRSLTMIGIALVGLIVVLFATNAYLYRSSSAEMRQSLNEIMIKPAAAKEGRP
jgi:type IV/VI secretion system ImpK/VasF family protein